ncbi:hypothetical protein [Erythrobacter rubeus]|uniref:Uncharacterized protein n=1 Tax=Erythrobacter rubeus TaxID=2760803 RepID=A0ABR8KVH7_9SPHN|nr:hypothetical protein [Erythrobacter rubeus]MBD2842247.1 hypothetical protein [Erythrobacter rubeus]
MLFNISEIAMATAVACSEGGKIPAYEERIKRLLKAGLVEVQSTESDHPRAARLLSAEEACLAALLSATTEMFDFGIHLQRAIVGAVRRSTVGLGPKAGTRKAHDLARAVEGIANEEKWVLTLSWRGREDIVARFVPYTMAQPNEGTERLMEASGRPLFGRLILPLNGIFEPFARRLRA